MKTELTLWGFKPGYIDTPTKLTKYTKAEMAYRTKNGWICGAYKVGDEPTGLILQANEIMKGRVA